MLWQEACWRPKAWKVPPDLWQEAPRINTKAATVLSSFIWKPCDCEDLSSNHQRLLLRSHLQEMDGVSVLIPSGYGSTVHPASFKKWVTETHFEEDRVVHWYYRRIYKRPMCCKVPKIPGETSTLSLLQPSGCQEQERERQDFEGQVYLSKVWNRYLCGSSKGMDMYQVSWVSMSLIYI